MDNDLLGTLIIVVILVAFVAPMIKEMLNFLIKKPKRVKVESQDIWQTIYKRRIKIAKAQKPRDMKKLTFVGDPDCHGVTFSRIRGYIPDTRMTEFFIGLRWYSFFPLWVIVPTRLCGNLVGGEVFIDARGLRNLGNVYGTVQNEKHAHEEETIREEEHAYIDSLLRHEEVVYLQEERVNAAITASSPGMIKEYWISRSELASDEAQEEEELE